MEHSLKTILIFTLIHSCLNSQENLSESRKIGDLSNRIQLLKSDLLQLKNDSGTSNAENYLQSIRDENQGFRNNSTTTLSKNSINRVLDEITPGELVRTDPDSGIKSEINKLDVRLSNLSNKLDQNKTNPSTEIIKNLDKNASLEDNLTESVKSSIIANRNDPITNEKPTASIVVTPKDTSDARIQYDLEPTPILGKTVTGKVESDFSPSETSRQYFEYKKRRNSTALKFDNSANKDPDKPKSADHKKRIKSNSSFNFYTGLIMPNSSNLGIAPISFEQGMQFSAEYLRDYETMSIGGSYFYKNFENERFDMDPIIPLSGSNSNHGFCISVAIEPKVTDLIFLRGKLSGGISFRTNEVIAEQYIKQYTGMSFKYSLLMGVGLRWSEYFNSIIFYEFDGVTETGDLGGITTHQFGIGLGLDF